MVLTRRRTASLAATAALAAAAGLSWYALAGDAAPRGGPRATPTTSPSVSASAAPAVKAAAAPSPSAAAPSGTPTPAPPPPSASAGSAAGRLTVDIAAVTFVDLADAYNTAATPLQKAVTRQPIDLKAVRAAVPAALAGYQRWLDGLRATKWPAAVQPDVTTYLRHSHIGVAALKDMAAAETPAALLAQNNRMGMRILQDAEAAVRTKLLDRS